MRPVLNLEALILVALAACLLPTGVVAPLGFAGLGFAWAWIRPSLRRPSWLTLGFGLVLALLVIEVLTQAVATQPGRFHDQVSRNYDGVWQGLDDVASRTVKRLESHPLPQGDRLPVFEILGSEAPAESSATILLLDDRGTVVAWSGKGLLHEIEDLPSLGVGRHHLASFSAVTLVSVQRLKVADREWHVAAGSSLRTDTFPFARVSGASPGWTVVPSGTHTSRQLLRFPSGSGPVLVVQEPRFERSSSSALAPSGWRRWAVLVWGVILMTQAWAWAERSWTWRAAVALGTGLFLLGLAAQAPAWVSALLAVAGGVSCWGQVNRRLGRSVVMAAALGIAGSLSSVLVAYRVQTATMLPDLGSRLWSNPGDLALRVALAVLAWGLLSAVPRSETRRQRLSVILFGASVLALLATAAFLDRTPVAFVLLITAGVALALWKRLGGSELQVAPLMALAVVAAMLSATAWELAYRVEQKQRIQDTLLPAMAPPTPGEIESLADEMESFLDSWDVQGLAPAAIDQLSSQDLAFEIWRRSPLARYGGLSALRVLPHGGRLSSFSFGLPLNEERWVDWSSPLLGSLPIPAWQDAVLVGDGSLHLRGDDWGYAEYALALQPGFRLREKYEGDLAEVLLRAGPTAGDAALRDLGGAVYGLFRSDGQRLVSPWPRPPQLPAAILAGGQGMVVTPDGRSQTFSEVGEDGVRVLFLPETGFLVALERIGSHALPTLLTLGALLVAIQLPRWTRAGLRSTWYHLWHSYSRRLVLVYSTLLLLPLGIINFLVVRAFEERLVGEQEAAGLLAVESVQGVLGEYVLALEPGFGIDAALDDELLNWLSSVVHHDVNLYWRGSVYASSKAELFTAGLLPRRIPGEIFSGLTLLGHKVSMRLNQTGRSEYLELYAPLTVPGVSFAQTRVIVSLPLLAQQEQTARQIASLRRRSLLGTAAVVLLITALGARLARRFTAPLTDIVEGTQRIAAGESSLKLRPVELELATLVDAIDDMAARIHAGRQELLREKRVVDRMVENITAGVVSLDDHGRVLMANRVAGEMIGLQVGQELVDVVEQKNRLAPLAEFVVEVTKDKLQQQTVVLEDAGGDEQEWTLVWVPLPGEGEPSALLVLEDVTEVLRGQRLQAWAEMARMIAHEIKNPLTPIRLSAEHMQEVYETDPEGFSAVFESCTTNILNQVEELQEIASEFSTYSRIPKIEPRPGDLVQIVDEIVGAYQSVSSSGARVVLNAPEQPVEASVDAKLLGRAIRNLVENALRAAPTDGRVEVSVEPHADETRIVVADNGPGVQEPLLAKIFDPYFSTHDAGTGLGLPIAKQIVEEHGGEITANNRDAGGLEVTITLPSV